MYRNIIAHLRLCGEKEISISSTNPVGQFWVLRRFSGQLFRSVRSVRSPCQRKNPGRTLFCPNNRILFFQVLLKHFPPILHCSLSAIYTKATRQPARITANDIVAQMIRVPELNEMLRRFHDSLLVHILFRESMITKINLF